MIQPHPGKDAPGDSAEASGVQERRVARRVRPIYRVFVSSTWFDLQAERRGLMDALNRMEEMRFVGMEFFGNRPDDTHDASIDQVDLCEVFVCVVGHRYGSGITESEYRRARALGLPCFVYMKRADTSRPDLTDGDPALASRLAAFKAELLRGHTVNEFASPEELAANATADLHNWVAAQWISVERDPPPPGRSPPTAPGSAQDRTNLLRLLDHVEGDWIGGVLDGSLHRRAWMDLGLDWRDDAVEHPWDRILVAPDRPVQTLGAKDSIAGIFTAAQHTLLVLGEPGAGKTTTLLELARELIRRARASADEPPPVVLALSAWTGRHRTLRDWLLDELNLRYQIPRRLAQGWLDDGRLTLLLDGLDEVGEGVREGCVSAINAFAREHNPPGLAVTCRVAEYAALRGRLGLRAAICLQPLTPNQIDRYLGAGGPGLESLRLAMHGDAALRELAQTPLMLSVMTVAWRDAGAEELRGGSGADRRTQLLEAYVQAALRRKGGQGEFPGPRTLDALSWLARGMRRRGLTLIAPEELQPDWLTGPWRQFAYFALTRMLAVLAVGLPFLVFADSAAKRVEVLAMGAWLGTWVTLIDWLFFKNRGAFTPVHRCAVLGVGILASGWTGGYILEEIGLRMQVRSDFWDSAAFLYFLLVAATMCTVTDIRTRDIKASDSIGWSWRQAAVRGAASMVWWHLFLIAVALEVTAWSILSHSPLPLNFRTAETPAVGAAAGCLVGAIAAAWLVPRGWRGWLGVVRCATLTLVGGEVGAAVVEPGLFALQVVNLFIIFFVALFGGFTATMDATRSRRVGAWFWVKVPLLAGVSIGAALAAIAGILFLFTMNTAHESLARGALVLLELSGSFGGTFGMVAFFRFGGFQGIKHFILRRLLAQGGMLPRNPSRLLDHAARLNLVQKVGFGYRFVHALLLEHLARETAPGRQDRAPV